jgi:hypothetical protein
VGHSGWLRFQPLLDGCYGGRPIAKRRSALFLRAIGSSFKIEILNVKFRLHLPTPGLYNANLLMFLLILHRFTLKVFYEIN